MIRIYPSGIELSIVKYANHTILHDRSIMRSPLFASLALVSRVVAQLEPNFTSNAGVEIYNPSSFFNTTGPWSLMSQAGDFLYIAGTHQHPMQLVDHHLR